MNRVPDGASGNEPACKCRRHRDAGSVPGSRISPEGRHGKKYRQN